MKYFIEREDGSWLMEPDGPLSSTGCWTRDPDKAWQFDKEDLKYSMDPLPGTQVYDAQGRLSTQMVMMDLRGEPPVTKFLREEGLFAPGQLTITEHEFIPYTNDADILNGHKKPDVYIDNLNRDLYLRFGEDEYYHRQHPSL